MHASLYFIEKNEIRLSVTWTKQISDSICVSYTTSVNIDHDIVRYIFRNKGAAAPDGFMLYEKDDFCRLCLPSFWYYYFDELGQGVAIDFPVKLKTKLTFHSKRFVLNNSSSLVEGPLIPLEKIIVVINRRAFSQDKLT